MPQAQENEELEQEIETPTGAEEPTGAVSAADDDDDDDSGSDDKPSRKERRAAKYQEALKEAREAKERLATYERELAELRGHVQGLRSVSQQQPANQAPPEEAQIEQLWEQQQTLLLQSKNPDISDDDRKRVIAQYRRLDRERRKLELKVDSRDVLPQQEGPNEYDIGAQVLRSEFPKILGDYALNLEAQAETAKLERKYRRKVDLEMAREACRIVAQRNGLMRTPTAPNPAAQARYSGVPGQAGAASGGNAGAKPSKLLWNNAMAYSAHLPNLTDDQKWKRWVKEVGKPEGHV